MAEYQDWVDNIVIHLRDCPRSVIVDAVRQAVIEFCERSHIWVYDCPEVEVVADELRYALELPLFTSICHVWTLKGREFVRECCKPDFRVEHPDQVVFAQPTDLKTLRAVVAVKPRRTSQTCPDFMVDDYFEPIASGAVSYLQMQPSSPWSQPNMAVAHQQIFENGVAQAINKRNRGFHLEPVRKSTRPHYF